jgi:hypothetical protein
LRTARTSIGGNQNTRRKKVVSVKSFARYLADGSEYDPWLGTWTISTPVSDDPGSTEYAVEGSSRKLPSADP